MQRLEGRLIYAASDLNDYLECTRLTELESLVASGKLSRPDVVDAQAELVRRKGHEHEQRYLETMRMRHLGEVEEIPRCQATIDAYRQAEQRTLDAMRRGVRIIYQATFFDGQLVGHADFLRRVETPSSLGAYGYEVIDTKLGLSAKPYYLVQLCNYSEHLERLQGALPSFGYVVFGNGEMTGFRLHDYMAYYRHLKRRFLDFVAGAQRTDRPHAYPLECSHCAICPWNADCEQQRRQDDHLSLVASMRRSQIAKLEEADILRVADLAQAPDDRRPDGMIAETFTKLRRQASLQVQARESGRPVYELLACDPPLGFALLPEPVAGDVFFDMEGDPLFEPGRSLEYLFGCWMPDDETPFRAFWGTTRDAEKRAFEAFVDFIGDRRQRYPMLHVYHYANYEKTALRRLAQQHCTREEEIDTLLREEVLVDLFTVVRQALMISEEGYSLKNLERFYGLERVTDVRKGAESIVMFERWLLERDQRILEDIERYNRDDCRSTHLLREWLLERRREAIATFGREIPPRALKPPNIKDAELERDEARRSDLERTLLRDVLPPQTEQEYEAMAPDRRIRYLLANLMAYHRREEKPAWWAYFDRCDNVDQLVEFDKEAIGGLKLAGDVAPRRTGRSSVYTYRFPDQPYKLAAGDAAVNPRTARSVGRIFCIDEDARILELKTTAGIESAGLITELIPPRPIIANEQRDALARIGSSFVADDFPKRYPATYDVLANRDPRVRGKQTLQPDRVNSETVGAVISELDHSYLFVQGPPGSGKSTIASQVICDLLVRNRRVAVTSTSHKAIHNLLHMVEECMAARGHSFRGRYKHSTSNAGSEYRSLLPTPFIESIGINNAFYGDDYQLAGGTGWLCAREELGCKFDYLFIDEAGQVSLADALANSLCAKNLVFLGDPSQLAQVSQGNHPIHVGDSVLQHLLGNHQTVPEHRGIFLDVSYRMHPEICAFVSDSMYENRLQPSDSARQHRVTTSARDYAGLYLAPVDHCANSSSSHEEANEILAQILVLLEEGAVFDSKPPAPSGGSRHLTARDVIVVTPYNAQRRLILRKLRDAGITDVRVGTVDKFQGQEAAVVFYSMATSSGEDVPRNVEFLLERNRFNVAVSRARAAMVLVCSPRLLDIRCRTPEQMALANLLCAFAETAQLYSVSAAAVS